MNVVISCKWRREFIVSQVFTGVSFSLTPSTALSESMFPDCLISGRQIQEKLCVALFWQQTKGSRGQRGHIARTHTRT